MKDNTLTLEERVARLEGALGWLETPPRLSRPWTVGGFFLSGAALWLAFLGLGIPNHPYQWALGAAAALLAYHRNWLLRPPGPAQYALGALNGVLLAFLFKLFIGSGRHYPFFWLKFPNWERRQSEETSWFHLLPDWGVAWQPSTLAAWEVDLTIVQTFLLVVTLVGALFRFQPFVSLTALLLLLVSVPAFSGFSWTWVFPAIGLAALSLYVQSQGPRPGRLSTR